MSNERTVSLVCTDAGQHGPRDLAELVMRDGVAVDLRLPGRERMRQGYERQSHQVADFDRKCPSCPRNPRASQARLDLIVSGLLELHADRRRVIVDVSTIGATLF